MGKFFIIIILLSGVASAWDLYYDSYFGSRSGSRPYKDYWGNSYKNYNNMWRDSDGDGIINYYDYNDRNPNVWTPYQRKNRGWGW